MGSGGRLSPVAALVRRHDRDRFLTALFAPEERREDLLALYAFNFEIARTREVVTEPMLGQIRLQWWRDAIAEIYEGRPVRRHEVTGPLAESVRRGGLSRAHLDALVDARERDLRDEAPATLPALEDYAAASSSRLVLLALEALGVRVAAADEAGRHLGIAWALVGLIRALPFHLRARRLYLPAEIVAQAGLDPRDVLELRRVPALPRAVEPVAEAARRHLAAARDRRCDVPRAALPALLLAPLADVWLRRLARAGHDPLDPVLARPDGIAPARLALAALRRRY